MEPRPKRVDALFRVDVDMRYIRGYRLKKYKTTILLANEITESSSKPYDEIKQHSKFFFS